MPPLWVVCPLTVTVSLRRRTEQRTMTPTTQKTTQPIPPLTAAMARRTQVLPQYELNESTNRLLTLIQVFFKATSCVVVTTCCSFGCNHLCWSRSAICSSPDLLALCGEQLLIETMHRSNKYYFIISRLLIIVLFHTTGGSDEGQDWELTKVGGYIQREKTAVTHPEN